MRLLLTAAVITLGVVSPVSSWARQTSQPVVSGVVRDDRGEPVVDVDVIALERVYGGRFVPASRARTDDRGMYRLRLVTPAIEHLIVVHAGPAGASKLGALPTQADAALTFPDVYYPAATGPSGAVSIKVGLNEERGGIDLTVVPHRGVRVRGTIEGLDAVAAGTTNLSLLALDGSEPVWALPLAAVRVAADGRFSFATVPPGAYVLWAVAFPLHVGRPTPTYQVLNSGGVVRQTVTRGGGIVGPPPSGDTYWIKDRIDVAGVDVQLSLTPHRGFQLAGRIVFDGDSARPSAAEMERSTIQVLTTDGMDLGPVPISGVEADGKFRIVPLPPGKYELEFRLAQTTTAKSGRWIWRPRSVSASGADLTGRPIQVTSKDIPGCGVHADGSHDAHPRRPSRRHRPAC